MKNVSEIQIALKILVYFSIVIIFFALSRPNYLEVNPLTQRVHDPPLIFCRSNFDREQG